MKHFITSVLIKKIRHLENIQIELSNEKIKHLILTGKNGSGKTSVIEQIRDFLVNIQSNKLNNVDLKSINLEFSSTTDINKYYQDGKFILAYFPATRVTAMINPHGPNRFQFNARYPIDGEHNSRASINFIQYLVNLKTQKSFAVSENSNQNSKETIEKTDKWFADFEKLLKRIFVDDKLELEFDSKNYNFYINTQGREKFTFNELSSGYSAIIAIITELMLRMELNKLATYDVEGIVLIDEIDAHLHIELQKSILPLLIQFFPQVQFIVTTHSPFILSSISNAIIYDLENKILVEDLTAYSSKAIIEDFFDSDQYSKIITQKLENYKKLKEQQDTLSPDQKIELTKLEDELESIGKNISPEVAAQVTHLKLKYGRS